MKSLVIITLSIFFLTATSVATPPNKVVVPLGGNAWAKGKAAITDDGLKQWLAGGTASVYFRVDKAQELTIALRLRVPAGKSSIKLSTGNNSFSRRLSNREFDTVAFGKILAQPGYVKINLTGLHKTGKFYAEVTDVILTNVNPDNELTYVKAGSSFHFGRRGPSVHLRYAIPDSVKRRIKYFYNEITVPMNMDVIGSYFMADGFSGGYFGMQVNSATERRVLFSIWSPFNTDDPKSIPDSLRVKLLSKGAQVHGGEFGDEGSGGQSYLLYPWQAGKTYAFLLRAEPDEKSKATIYTAWFKEAGKADWLLVARFSRPQTSGYLTDLYSFVENFEPENGDKTRMAYFTNQWFVDDAGGWHSSKQVTYTGDETARKNFRKDYSGGRREGKLFLRNGGFFDDLTPLNQKFILDNGSTRPVINFQKLPQ